MEPSCPPAVVDLVGSTGWEQLSPAPHRSVEPTEPADRRDDAAAGTASRWRVGAHWVSRSASPTRAEAEAAGASWLTGSAADSASGSGRGVSAGRVVLLDGPWLVLAGPPGWPADRPERHPEPDGIPAAVGRALRQLHQIDPSCCPVARSLDDELAGLAEAVSAGAVDLARLPEPYRRYQPSQLLELARLAVDERTDDQVVSHGRLVLSNVVLDGGAPSGFLGLDRLAVAPRHLDLAVVHRQLQQVFGGEAVFAFYEGYGTDPDLVLLDQGVLVDVIRSASSGGAAAGPGRPGSPAPRRP